MKNKIPFVIIPPISESVKKLNAAMEGSAEEDNIEISIIDDLRELQQFMGSAGQSLVIFSNVKKCANFCQDNKSTIVRTNSKVILFTPNEIPSKTLAKFLKAGLTEAILETASPKSIIYKIKLLLRSIQNTPKKIEGDQQVKTLINSEQPSQKSNLRLEKLISEKNINENNKAPQGLKEENTDFLSSRNSNLQGKNTNPSDDIQTHWKTKRAQETEQDQTQDIEEISELQRLNSSEQIDMYYRMKKEKKTSIELIQNPEEEPSFNENAQEIKEDEQSKKMDPEINLENVKPNSSLEQKEKNEELKKTNLFLNKNPNNSSPKDSAKEIDLHQEDKNQEKTDKQKELENALEEIDAIIAEAKKRQAAGESLDLGGYLKGKISNNKSDITENEINRNNQSEDLIDPATMKKIDDIDLKKESEDDESKAINEEASSEKIKPESFSLNKKPSKELNSEDKATQNNSKNPNIISDHIIQKRSAKIQEAPIKSKSEYLPEETAKKERDLLSSLKQSSKDRIESNFNKNEIKKEETEEEDLKKSKSINLSLIASEKDKKDDIKNEDDKKRLNKNQTNLQLAPAQTNNEEKENEMEEEQSNDQIKSHSSTNLNIEKESKPKRKFEYSDKVDKFYRNKSSNNSDHNWDNISSNDFQTLAKEDKIKKIQELNKEQENPKQLSENSIDYRKIRAEFSQIISKEHSSSTLNDNHSADELASIKNKDQEDVIEIDPCGFDFGINVLNLINKKEPKNSDFYKLLSEELITKYKAYSVFYAFKNSTKEHSETFDSFIHYGTDLVENYLKEWWIDIKNDPKSQDYYFNKTMTTWLCREVEEKNSSNGKFWEDVELPQWAENELTNKKVELVFPYYDGLDRMGVAVLFFPNGIQPKFEKSILTSLEMIRSIFFENIERKNLSSVPTNLFENETDIEKTTEKKSFLNKFNGFFNKNKAG